jgi:hypothetical protein
MSPLGQGSLDGKDKARSIEKCKTHTSEKKMTSVAEQEIDDLKTVLIQRSYRVRSYLFVLKSTNQN